MCYNAFMNKVGNIARNTSYLTVALILQKIISFSYFTILARNLGPADLGKYYFAISFTTIFAILIDLGFMNFLTREIAKHRDRANVLLGNVLSVKILLAMITAILVVVFINFTPHDPLTKDLVYLSIICMILDSFTTTFFAVLRGFHNLKYESLTSVIFQLVVLIFGLLALYLNYSLRLIMASLIIASTYNFIYSFWVLKRKMKLKLRLLYDPGIVSSIFQISLPFALFAIFQRVYTYLDSVLLSLFAGDYYVGIYQVSFKIIFALQFLPMAFTASLYPAMSTYWLSNREQLKVAFERAMNYLIIISVPITVGSIILAPQIISLFKSGYQEAILPLRLTMAAAFFIFVNFPIGSLLNACDRQRRNTINMLIVMIVSVGINLALIPLWQADGAALTVLLTNALMFVLGMVLVPKIIKYQLKNNATVLGKSILASAFMAAFINYYLPSWNIILLILLAMVIYFASSFALGSFHRADLQYILKSFKKTPPPVNNENLE